MHTKYILKTAVWGCIAALTLGACTKGFPDVNKNPLLPDEELLTKDGVLNGTYLPELQFQPIHTGTSGTDFVNDYQVTNNLTMDSWMGYLAPRDAKWPSKNLSQFHFAENWSNGTFSAGVTKVFAPWIQLKKLNYDAANKNLEIWHIAQISKIMGIHRTTDKYGAIPYFNVGSGSFNVAYDSQEKIYNSFFKELDEAVQHLYQFSLSTPIIPKASDVVYDGDALKWAKLGNSLMLRLAMRVRYVAPALSREWAEKAIHHPAGLIESLDDIAKLDEGAGIRTKNALFTIAGAYNDTRMGASIQVYLKGYKDPRMSAYFTGQTDIAVPPAITQTGDAYNNAAKPKVDEFSPTYWFKSSETSFLKAEAALAGYSVDGKAKDFYEEGIRRSFAENNITTNPEPYINGTTTPATFVDAQNPQFSSLAPTSATVAWKEDATEEQKLEKIIIQKYIAIYPDGQEAWSEWRRTGYPKLIEPKGNISNYGVVTSDGHKDGVRCWPYPNSELQGGNAANVKTAIGEYRGGNNSAAVNVWWDVKVKN